MKKFGNFILEFICVFSIFFLLFSFYSKSIFYNYVRDTIKNGYDYSEMDNNQLEELFNEKEVNKLVNKYVNITIDSVIDQDELNDIDIENDMIAFLKDNKGMLEKKYNVKISDQDIESIKDSGEFNTLTNDFKTSIIDASNNLQEKYKNLLKAYKFMCSDLFKIVLIILLLLDIIIYSLVNKSKIKWIKLLGSCLIANGILTIIMGLVLHFGFNSYFNSNIGFINIIIYGFICLAVGVITYYIYKFICKLRGDIIDLSS